LLSIHYNSILFDGNSYLDLDYYHLFYYYKTMLIEEQVP
jgi:hypothetical protein